MGRVSTFPIVFTTAVAIALTFCSCTDEPSGPAPVITSHEFEWEVDTLDTKARLDVTAIWGSSKSDIYIGAIVNANETGAWHWDGVRWTPVEEILNQRQNARCVDGVDSTFVVFVGAGALPISQILIYNSGNWETMALPQQLRNTTTLKVVSREEMYLGGVDGILKYKSGSWEWLLDSTDSKQDGTYEFWPLSMLYKHGRIDQFTSIRVWDGERDKLYLWRWCDGRYAAVDSFENYGRHTTDARFGMFIYNLGPEVYSTGMIGIFKLVGDEWVYAYCHSGGPITGTRNNLTVMSDTLFHFNGKNWQNITPDAFRNIGMGYLGRVLLIDDVLFVATTYSNGNTIVFRGKQK